MQFPILKNVRKKKNVIIHMEKKRQQRAVDIFFVSSIKFPVNLEFVAHFVFYQFRNYLNLHF